MVKKNLSLCLFYCLFKTMNVIRRIYCSSDSLKNRYDFRGKEIFFGLFWRAKAFFELNGWDSHFRVKGVAFNLGALQLECLLLYSITQGGPRKC